MEMNSGPESMNNGDQIFIKIVSEGKEHLITTYRNEYRSLMMLIKDKIYPEGFGECGGMGRCATCQVKLNDAREISDMDRNEWTTLSKQDITDPSIRLSCQLFVDESLHLSIVNVLT